MLHECERLKKNLEILIKMDMYMLGEWFVCLFNDLRFHFDV